MSAIEVNKDISPEDVQRPLSDALGPDYRVSVTSGSSVKFQRNYVIRGTARVSQSGGRTSLRVSPGALVVIAGINALVTTPKIRHILEQAFSPAA